MGTPGQVQEWEVECSKSILRKRLLSTGNEPIGEGCAGSLGDTSAKKRGITISNITRNGEETTYRLITGESALTSRHLFKIGVSVSASCPVCSEVEEPGGRLLLEFPRYHDLIRKYFHEEGLVVITKTRERMPTP